MVPASQPDAAEVLARLKLKNTATHLRVLLLSLQHV